MQLVNGYEDDRISIHDRGLHYGDGLFETIRIIDGKLPAHWDRHVARLHRGCERLGMPLVPYELLAEEANRCLKSMTDGVLKIIVTCGSGERGYRRSSTGEPTRILVMYPAPSYPSSYYDEGIAARVCRTRLGCNEALAGIKHLNRIEQVLARSEWTDPGIAEGLMLDTGGNVIEGTMTNLFFVTRGGLRTPDVSQCGVAGILRERVMERAAADGMRCESGAYTLADLRNAEEIFVCNSVVGVWPVRQLECREYRIGPVTAQVAGWFAG